MFGIFVSALNVLLGFVFRSVIIKFVIFFALYFVITGFAAVLANSGLLPDASSLTSSLGGIPATVWYFLDLFGVTVGLKIVVAAMVARFTIRRIPFIG
jgi:hypothetical protein